jgi:cyanase
MAEQIETKNATGWCPTNNAPATSLFVTYTGPTDPLIYRFYEMVMVNGPAWKALIEEEFGDGIMSAIDFDMAMERVANPKGDRVKITMSGKFLPNKYYGASGNGA